MSILVLVGSAFAKGWQRGRAAAECECRVSSWLRCTSERLGEGAIDLITKGAGHCRLPFRFPIYAISFPVGRQEFIR